MTDDTTTNEGDITLDLPDDVEGSGFKKFHVVLEDVDGHRIKLIREPADDAEGHGVELRAATDDAEGHVRVRIAVDDPQLRSKVARVRLELEDADGHGFRKFHGEVDDVDGHRIKLISEPADAPERVHGI